MRHASPLIWDTWNEGRPLIGDLRACTRVTVEPDWLLRTEMAPGKWPVDRCPVRWWQRRDNSQVELEIPQGNLKTVSIDRSIDTDAAQLNLELLNTLPEYNSPGPPTFGGGGRQSPSVFAKPGALTYDFGEHSDARARWGDASNEWHRVLQPGALLRSFQGYGGHNKTIDEAIEDGNLLLTGQWIVDDVTPTHAGTLTLVARDMAALLVDQVARPPLMPKSWYPCRFYRWTTEFRKITKPVAPPDPNAPPPSQEVVIPKRIRYRDSSADHWYTSNVAIHGHRGTDSVDGNPGTFALSVGNSHPSRPFTTDFFEYDVGEQINAVWLVPWGGNYEVFISVFEDGRWVGDQIVPYDHAPLIGNQPTVVDTGADIAYVSSGGIAWEQPTRFQLPRMYRADRLRVTFRNHTRSQWGPWFYRCGIREINAEIHSGGQAGGSGKWMNSIIPAPMWMDLAAVHGGDGYYAISDKGQIEEFGVAIKYGQPFGAPLSATRTAAQSIVVTLDDEGYYVLAGSGKVFAYGTAVHHGDLSGDGVGDAVTLCLTHTGLGYWIVRRGGQIASFGDAPPYLDAPGMIGAAAAHPSAYGLWLYNEVGPITVQGAAINYGSPPQTCPGLLGSGIQATPTGLGYICVEEFGAIQVFGDAVNLGATSGFLPPPYPPGVAPAPKEPRINALALAPVTGAEVRGYATLAYDGRIFPQGDWYPYGQPIDDEVEVKRPGNYTDYADIIRTFLLWSGFWLMEDGSDPVRLAQRMAEVPLVYGNIETTGAWSEDPLTEDFFQNKPIIDIINAIKEVVAYLFWVDDEGGARFEPPNVWSAGNHWQEDGPIVADGKPAPGDAAGNHTNLIPVIDERVNMTQYTAQTTKRNSRSSIMVGTDDPLLDLEGTRSYTHTPADTFLRGMVVPASIAVPTNVSTSELRIMAQLVGLYIWLARRTGSVGCLANPAIQINDQVRILERATSEVHLHYVRGVQTTHDLKSGEYTMTLTTHWLGDRDKWVIHVNSEGDVQYAGDDPILQVFEGIDRYELSSEAYEWVRSRRPGPDGETANTAAADALSQVNDIDEPDGDDGAAT